MKKLTATPKWGKPYSTTLETLFQNALSGSEYDSGELEAATQTASNNSKALGRLVEVLREKGVLTLEDAIEVSGFYGTVRLESEDDGEA